MGSIQLSQQFQTSAFEKDPSMKQNCKSCKKDFDSLLKHLNRAKKCQNNYGEEFQKRDNKRANESKKNGKDKVKIVCKNCNGNFVSLAQHLRKNQLCQATYDTKNNGKDKVKIVCKNCNGSFVSLV